MPMIAMDVAKVDVNKPLLSAIRKKEYTSKISAPARPEVKNVKSYSATPLRIYAKSRLSK